MKVQILGEYFEGYLRSVSAVICPTCGYAIILVPAAGATKRGLCPCGVAATAVPDGPTLFSLPAEATDAQPNRG